MSFPLLPIIIGSASAVIGAAGLTSGTIGAKKLKEANERVEKSRLDYEKERKTLETIDKKTLYSLKKLGKLKLETIQDFELFALAFEQIKNRPSFETKTEELPHIPKVPLKKVEKLQVASTEILGTALAAGGSGALIGFAAYGGIMSLGVASTGTAIGSLSGAAATKATLAALGGGSIAAGGGGIALGQLVLGVAVAAPIIAISGGFALYKGQDYEKKSHEIQNEVKDVLKLIAIAVEYLKELRSYTNDMYSEIDKLRCVYLDEVEQLRKLVDKNANYNNYTIEEKELVDINIKLVAILYKLTTQDLLQPSNNKEEQQKLLKAEIEETLETSKKVYNQLTTDIKY
ncbi:hypothetical protein [Salinicoccus roseus]|uniref:hypothetical protein n=1 Tax=Salinicoccus roseus TaxID=45670 RepID=UPI002300E709|nr:hypothetical protein [Salinicoccus roseus]